MVLYLLRDLLWRNWPMYALMGPLMCVVWIPIALGHIELRWGVTLSLFMAAALGPMTSMTTVALREIRILPIRFRDLWTLTWLAATVVSSAFMFLTTSVGVAITMSFSESATVGLETPVLVAIYSYLLTNAILALLPALNYTSRNMQPGATTTALMSGIVVLFLASMGLPYFLAPHLPTSFDQLSGVSIAILAAGIAASFAVLAWRPTAGIGTGAAHRSQAAHRTRPRVADSLTGASRVLVPYLAVTSLVTSLIVGGYAWYASSQGGNVATFLGDDDLSRAAYMLVAMSSPWMPWARLLKSLPLSSRVINLLLVATSVATWCVIVGTVWALGPVVGSAVPAWVSPTTLAWVSGMSAFVNALSFRNQGSMVWIVGPTVVTGPFLLGIIGRAQNPWSMWFLLGAVISFAGAAWINHLTLTRCGSASRAFRRPTQGPFGLSGPVAPR